METSSEFNSAKLEEIRKKTFNSELKDLFHQISVNEENAGPTVSEDVSAILKRELLIKMHSLFYSILSLKNGPSININSPFEKSIYHEKYQQIKRNLLEKYNVNDFLIMSYSNDYHVFSDFIAETPEEITEVFISPYGEVIKKIIESDSYISIELDDRNKLEFEIESIVSRLKDSKYLYALSYKNFVKKLTPETLFSIGKNKLHPVLLCTSNKRIEIDDVMSFLSADEDFTGILTKIFEKTEIKTIKEMDAYLELELVNLMLSDSFELYLLMFTGKFDNDIFITLRHIYARLNKIISGDSRVIFFEKNKFVLSLKDEDVNKINQYIMDLNNIYYNQFSFKKIDYNKSKNLYYSLYKFSV